jgi:hypothetical protein
MNAEAPYAAPMELGDAVHERYSVLIKRLTTVFGFIMSDHADRRPACVQEMGAWYRPGRIRVREDAVDGFENAPAAFIRMLRGENLGRTLVRVAGAPAA